MIDTAFIKKNSSKILSYMLSVVLGCAVYSIYGVSIFSVYTLAVIVINLAMFMFCSFVNKHRIIGGFLLVILILVVLMTFMRFAIGRDLAAGFSEWFLSGGTRTSTKTDYLLALTFSFTFFFPVVVYYFTQALYRMGFLVLISLIPCTISVKAIASISTTYVAIISVLNVALLIDELGKNKALHTKLHNKRASIISAGAFIFILLLISAIIPKSSDTKYYDTFEMLFMDTTASLGSDYTDFGETSGDASSYRSFQNRLMYTISIDEQLYLKRQTFDFYDFENNYWTYDKESSLSSTYTGSEYEEIQLKLNLETLQEAYKVAVKYDSTLATRYDIEKLVAYEGFSDTIKTAYVSANNFSARYIPVTSRAISIVSDSIENFAISKSGVFRMRGKETTDKNASYTITYYDENKTLNTWINLGGADFDDATIELLLNETYEILTANDCDTNLIDTLDAFITQYDDAMSYKTMWQESDMDSIPSEITALAKEITAGCEYDYEKASALVEYFYAGDSGYTYNLEYVAEDDSIEYFIFESKTGTCSDFATAFSLLARAVGLNVRYCEGYVPDYSGNANIYYVRDSSSHAYPEVYIQGIGWYIYEPTIASVYNSDITTTATTLSLTVDYSMVKSICIVALITIIVVLLVAKISPIIEEKLFLNKVASQINEVAVGLIYDRTLKLSKKYDKAPYRFTPYELAQMFYEKLHVDISEFAFMVESVFYGGNIATDEEKQMAKSTYQSLKKQIKENKKRSAKKNDKQ